MASVDEQIRTAGASISNNIDALGHDRALLAQNLLSQLRNLVEAVAVRLHLGDGGIEFDYNLTGPAIGWVGSANKNKNFLHRFHKLLQMSVSHYTFEGDASERLMLKYFEYLVRTRALLEDECDVRILENLEDFPVDLDPALRVYHEKIAERIRVVRRLPRDEGRRSRYYVNKVRPFFTGGRIYYEVTFSSVTDRINKPERVIAFTDIDMSDKYAANLTVIGDSIEALGQTMPITIIRDWEVSIRPCELDNFAKILGRSMKTSSGGTEYRNLMRYLTDTSASLLDLMDMPTARYDHITGIIRSGVREPQILPMLDQARQLVGSARAGANVLRYLMLDMNNRIIKLQYFPETCSSLSDLYLSWGCRPFDEMPYCTSLRGHNPRFSDLAASIDATGREHEMLARRVKNNVETRGVLYTPLSELADLGEVSALVAKYNSKVYYKHTGRILVIDKGHVFMREYEDGTVDIVERIQEFASSGVEGYEVAVKRWLDETPLEVDDDVKRSALQRLFADSRVALIYGAAGTGKSTMVNYIANYFGEKDKLFLAQTNPAKDNLERKVSAHNSDFRTISSQIARTDNQPAYDVLIIDECSTVGNADLLKVLNATSFRLLVLVGDVYQIESIPFGNWFSIARSFVPASSVFELTTPYRTKNDTLLDFWTKVRLLDDGIEEAISKHGYSAVLNEAFFTPRHGDEIVLCLNYDGLYGINNVNRFLQSSNRGKSATWGVATYKVDDPVLFGDVDRFKPLIFNNLKGRIVDVDVSNERIRFDVWLDRSVTEFDVDGFDLRYVGDSTVQFDVYLAGSSDDDEELVNTTVPFQVAYAVSIHKAQGLEYDSVKVVITDANEDDFSHSIFYTAITRARESLQIFWTPETQQAVLSRLERVANTKDVAILVARRGLTVARA